MTALGFTGTRYGMTEDQRLAVRRLVALHLTTSAHHGDCIGADAQFHALCRELPTSFVVVHPPLNEQYRAFCAGDEHRAPLPYMRRNARIVAESDVMIAAPFEAEEQERGGTWRTVGLARKAGRPLFIVWPSGAVVEERVA